MTDYVKIPGLKDARPPNNCYVCTRPARLEITGLTEAFICDACLERVAGVRITDPKQNKVFLRAEELEALVEHANERAAKTIERLEKVNRRARTIKSPWAR
jgi:hypothetical protein